jgi:hypothetical protein
LFDHTGLQSTRTGLSRVEMQVFVKEGGWQMIAQNFSSQKGGLTEQYTRRRPA